MISRYWTPAFAGVTSKKWRHFLVKKRVRVENLLVRMSPKRKIRERVVGV